MSVERERHTEFRQDGEVRATVVDRAEAGGWTVALEISLRLVLADGREVIVRKELRTRATSVRGRRSRTVAQVCIDAAHVAGVWPMGGPGNGRR